MKLGIVALTSGALAVGATALALAVAPPPAVTGGLLGTGVLTVHSGIDVHLSGGKGFVMENADFPQGSTVGWHSHLTPVVVAVTAGTLTLYDISGPKCKPYRYKAGQGFIEPANHIHLARNEGKTKASIEATYIGVSQRLRANPNNLDVGAERPSKCPASVQ
jgi:quercetin dioxygenase-like cupin family protein